MDSEIQAEDIDDNYWAEMRWSAAYSQWLEHDSTNLEALIRDPDSNFPPWVREFLADLAAGKVSRGKGGRPEERYDWAERALVAEVFDEWNKAKMLPRVSRSGSPKDKACAIVAARRGATADAIRGVVNKLIKHGITLERWISWGCPDWKRIK